MSFSSDGHRSPLNPHHLRSDLTPTPITSNYQVKRRALLILDRLLLLLRSPAFATRSTPYITIIMLLPSDGVFGWLIWSLTTIREEVTEIDP